MNDQQLTPPSTHDGGGAVRLRRGRLRYRIARYLVFAVVVSLLVSAVVLVVLRDRATRRSMEAAARTYTALIASPVVDAVILFRDTGAHVLERRLAGWIGLNDDVVALEVADVQGRVAMRADRDGVETFRGNAVPKVTDAVMLDEIRRLEPTAVRVISDNGRPLYRVVAPAVEEWGRHTYSLVATFDYAEVERQMAVAVWVVAGSLAIGMLLALVVSLRLARSITRSVDRLREGVQRFRDGNLEERVDIRSQDEIEDLAEAFNAMAESLLESIEQLRHANRELENLDQIKADLVANVSHELRTPLTALRGYLELLGDGDLGELGGEAVQAVEVCQKNVSRLSLRIEELVQMSQVEDRRPKIHELDEVHVGHLLTGAVETLIPRLEEKGITCLISLASDLPTVKASPEQIERVFLNLLDNAAKFTQHGGAVQVNAACASVDGRRGVEVTVADTGPGIPPEEQLRIFDRFYQVDPSARRRHGGMGLGLSLVRNVVEGHRGSVWVESVVGEGAAFKVWLPCRPLEDSSGHVAVLEESHSGTLKVFRRSSAGE